MQYQRLYMYSDAAENDTAELIDLSFGSTFYTQSRETSLCFRLNPFDSLKDFSFKFSNTRVSPRVCYD